MNRPGFRGGKSLRRYDCVLSFAMRTLVARAPNIRYRCVADLGEKNLNGSSGSVAVSAPRNITVGLQR